MQYNVSIKNWQSSFSQEEAQKIIVALESGQVIVFPNLPFNLEADEQRLLELKLEPKRAKNISFNAKNNEVRGLADLTVKHSVQKMMSRYHQMATQLLDNIAPQYRACDASGRTSYRPIEINGRKAPSYRKDDTRLHVDAFPSTPTNNHRILRIFTNINPYNESRFWKVGEPFAEVIEQFLPKVRKPYFLEAELLNFFKVTRKKRLPYDHYMLNIHDMMKADLAYQAKVNATDMVFPSGSTWIVYTDLVSHAALAGRFVLEQTFYPKVSDMLNQNLSPQYQMSRLLML